MPMTAWRATVVVLSLGVLAASLLPPHKASHLKPKNWHA
jgi:hypothetical protein